MWKVQYKALVTIKYMMFWRGGFLLCYWKSNSNWLELLRHLSSYIKGVQTCRGLPGWLIQQLYDLNKITGSFHLCTVTLLRLLIFLPAILILICASSSPAFLMMYSAYKLNKQGDDIQPWRTPFPFWNQSVFPCPVLTVASWPAYRFLKRHISNMQNSVINYCHQAAGYLVLSLFFIIYIQMPGGRGLS